MANQVLTQDISVCKDGEFKSLRNQMIFKDNNWLDIAPNTSYNFNQFSVYNQSNDTWYTLTTPLWQPLVMNSHETNDKEGITHFNSPYWEDASYLGNNFKLFNFDYGRFPLISSSQYPSTVQLVVNDDYCITNFDEDIDFELVYSNNSISNWFSSIKINLLYVPELTNGGYRAIYGFNVVATANGTANNNTLHAEYLAKGVQTGIYYFGIKLYTYTIYV